MTNVLVPELRPGDIVVMDNLSSRKRAAIRDLIKEVGASLRYLPPYSPHFKPIEKAFARLKAMLRHATTRPSYRSRPSSTPLPSDCGHRFYKTRPNHRRIAC
ncbi:transposase [Novosphingobium chloroacetimidivorans]|uniref:Transposase n=1 Tax=Novosphingobium chloroacetimidivorans TaxID=1428314 RepID=A0A7W7KDR2_9SPHN|nr:transposase [Novosphingobium chloroacetimidivorans]